MTEEPRPVDMAKQRIVYAVPGVDTVVVQTDLEFEGSDSEPLSLDPSREIISQIVDFLRFHLSR